MKLGIGFTGAPFSVMKFIEYAKLAEKAGVDSFWVAEDYFFRDAVSIVSSVAVNTRKIKLATGVINPYTRNPVLIAQTIATLDELSGGRAILALGTGVPSLIENMGIKFEKPLTAIKESVQVIRTLFETGEASFDGKVFKIKDVKFGRNPYFELLEPFEPIRRRVPIYVAAIGPKMLQLAGEIGDGVLLTAGCSKQYVRYAVEKIKAGAEKAGRNFEEIDVACYILYSPYDFEKVNPALKGFLAFAIAYSPPQSLRRDGISIETSEIIRKTLESKGMHEASKLITEEIAEIYSVFGRVEECRKKILEYVKSGVKLPIVMSFDSNISYVLETIKEIVSG